MDRIIFMPRERAIPPDGRSDLLRLAKELSLPLLSACGGKGKCGKCSVIVSKAGGPLPDPTERERQALGELVEKGHRLACETVRVEHALFYGARLRGCLLKTARCGIRQSAR